MVRLAGADRKRVPDENFEYGLSLAHLERWGDARAALLAGHRACPRQERFLTELAGVAFQQKNYPEAAKWLRGALRIKPDDRYARDFSGTVYYLMGNLPAALRAWNRVDKPKINALRFDPQLRVHRLILDRAFAFAPQSLLELDQFETTQVRLKGLGIFPTDNMDLRARADGKFDVDFHAFELHGFGNTRTQALLSTLSGLPYETIYPSYFNIHRDAMNFESLLRWDAQKRRAWAALSAPLRALPAWRWRLWTDDRAENWTVRRSFTGDAPSRGSLQLKRAAAGAELTSFASGRLQWRMGATLSDRTYTHVTQGPALSGDVLARGFQLKPEAAVKYQLIDAPEHRFRLSAGAQAEIARLWSSPARLYSTMQGSMRLHWFPQAAGDAYEFTEQVRGGGAMGRVPFDELWLIGVERDTELWYRGRIGTRDGRKGSSPLADRYLLSNTDFYRRVYSNGFISVAAGPLLDVARTAAPNAALAPAQWMVSTGAEAKLTVLGTSVVVTYGRDLRTGTNAVFATVMK